VKKALKKTYIMFYFIFDIFSLFAAMCLFLAYCLTVSFLIQIFISQQEKLAFFCTNYFIIPEYFAELLFFLVNFCPRVHQVAVFKI